MEESITMNVSEESKTIVRDRLLNDLALIQAWASLLVKQEDASVEIVKKWAEAILRLSYHYENDVRDLFNFVIEQKDQDV